MMFEAEMTYLSRILDKFHLKTTRVVVDRPRQQDLAFWRESIQLRDTSFERMFYEILRRAKEQTIYKLSDALMCGYILLLLPQQEERTALVVGPYLTSDLTKEQLLEMAERIKLPTTEIPQLEKALGTVPVIREERFLFGMLHTLGEIVWGEENAYETVDLNWELDQMVGHPIISEHHRAEAILERMRSMEQRYAVENELMDKVSRGMTHRAEAMIKAASGAMADLRRNDPIRDVKNYTIILNTLLRKSAEKGGVHPVYLDTISGEFSYRLENITKEAEGYELMSQMVRDYCRLVRKHTTKQYSPVVQKTVAYMEADIAADLSLRTLAKVQNINASYLSGLFRKETGKTITEFVTERRMEKAAHLLRSTQLQIQTVAQHCGMSDANYFSKIFKRFYSITPKEFREGR